MAAPGPAGGAYPGANGKIAYSNTPAGGAADIWVMNADGSGPMQLTTDPASDGNAAWSPDGTKIAFDSTRSGDGEIWVMDADGDNQVNLSQEPTTAETGPAWSPGGTKIAFNSLRNSNRDVYVMNADGSGVDQRLTTDAKQDTSPEWSPDGTKIAFGRSTAGQQDSDIWVMDAEGNDQTQLTSTAGNELGPAWSPDGAKIAFGGGGEVNVMNPNGTNQTALTTDPGTDTAPGWQIAPPVNQSQPSIPPSATEGDSVACDPGTWTGSSAFSYQWLRNGTPLTGATSSSYQLTSADVGASIVCRVTATNSAGSSSADSNALVPSAAPETPPDETPPDETPPDEEPPVPDATPPGPLTIRELNATDPPTLGKDVNVAPAKGKVFVSVPGGAARVSQSVPGLKGREFVPLEEARQIPVRSILDTRRGQVRLFTARNRKGTRLQPGAFGAGVFQVLQSRKRKARGLTVLRLKGLAARFRRCTQGKSIADESASAARRRLSRRTIRRLRAKAKGRYRTRGRRSAATVRGTNWVMTDRCDGTLTKVTRGKVAVRDFRRKRTVVLKRGKSYLARAPGS